ncbi:unnamed protein product [Lactuca virosa]|uniref:Uncharacterized protein n=1 Tax=Lactuca virosa TaxID=75947 RepID=A0AAU9LWB3_9ASTR|nr:unnamed protein product [Lactuca virosa]
MGFFPHEKTSNSRRYVGIWFTMDPNIVLWVDKPLLDKSGSVLTLSEEAKSRNLFTSSTTAKHSLHLVISVPQFERRFSFMHLTKWVKESQQGNLPGGKLVAVKRKTNKGFYRYKPFRTSTEFMDGR